MRNGVALCRSVIAPDALYLGLENKEQELTGIEVTGGAGRKSH